MIASIIQRVSNQTDTGITAAREELQEARKRIRDPILLNKEIERIRIRRRSH